jgi:ubiquinone/menaquinone biosynthesis C-methylase UbiE
MAQHEWRGFYSKEADDYERRRYHSLYGRLFRDIHRDLIATILAPNTPLERVLDVASGTGQLLPPLRDAAQMVVACDLTPEMLYVARQQHGEEKIAYCLSEAGHLPFGDNNFNVVASSRFLHLFNTETQATLIAEMARVLAPGGLLIVDFYNATPRRILSPFIGIYRALAGRRRENDWYTSIVEAKSMIESIGLQVKGVYGVGSYMLVPTLIAPRPWQRQMARLFSGPLKQMAEQFVLVASKA